MVQILKYGGGSDCCKSNKNVVRNIFIVIDLSVYFQEFNRAVLSYHIVKGVFLRS